MWFWIVSRKTTIYIRMHDRTPWVPWPWLTGTLKTPETGPMVIKFRTLFTVWMSFWTNLPFAPPPRLVRGASPVVHLNSSRSPSCRRSANGNQGGKYHSYPAVTTRRSKWATRFSWEIGKQHEKTSNPLTFAKQIFKHLSPCTDASKLSPPGQKDFQAPLRPVKDSATGLPQNVRSGPTPPWWPITTRPRSNTKGFRRGRSTKPEASWSCKGFLSYIKRWSSHVHLPISPVDQNHLKKPLLGTSIGTHNQKEGDIVDIDPKSYAALTQKCGRQQQHHQQQT